MTERVWKICLTPGLYTELYIYTRSNRLSGISDIMTALRICLLTLWVVGTTHAILSCGSRDAVFSDPYSSTSLSTAAGTDGKFDILSLTFKESPTSNNNSFTEISFTLKSAFDNTLLPCYGSRTVVNPVTDGINGTCIYPGGVMGDVNTTFMYSQDRWAGYEHDPYARLYIDQWFFCNYDSSPRVRP